MRLLLAASAAFLLLTNTVNAKAPSWLPDAIAANVVLGNNGRGFCSGSFIDKKARLIATASHCIEGSWHDENREDVNPITGEISHRTVRVYDPLEVWKNNYDPDTYQYIGRTSLVVEIKGRNSKDDTALLQVKDKSFVPAIVLHITAKDHTPEVGDDVFVIGNSFVVLDDSVSFGRVAASRRLIDVGAGDTKFFQIQAAIAPGNSGGPVLDEDGNFIGTVTAGINGIFLIAPVQSMRDLLRASGFKDVFDPAPAVQSGTDAR